MNFINWRAILAASVISAALVGSPGCGDNANSQTIVIYSPHGKYLEKEMKSRFEAEYPGWTVVFQDMSGATILPRVSAEKTNPQASLWWGGSPGDFKRAEAEGLLEAYVPAWAGSLPAQAKSATGGWTATFLTPEIIMFNPKKLPRDEVPTDWDGLIDPKWKGHLAIRDVRASTGMTLIFGALILREKQRPGSIDAGFDFLKKLDANTGAYAAQPDILYDMLEKEGPYLLSPWNLPDVLNLKKTVGRSLDFVLPKETMVNVEPIALIKNGAAPAGAKLFYDFVNRPEQLAAMAQLFDRIPARTDIPPEKLPESMRDLKLNVMKLDMDDFDRNIEEWMHRWDTEIKGKGGR